MIKKYTFDGGNLKLYKSNAEKHRKNPMALASSCRIYFKKYYEVLHTFDGEIPFEKLKAIEIAVDNWSADKELNKLYSNPYFLYAEVEVNNKLWSGIVKMENQMFFISNGRWDVPSDYSI